MSPNKFLEPLMLSWHVVLKRPKLMQIVHNVPKRLKVQWCVYNHTYHNSGADLEPEESIFPAAVL